MLYKDIWECSHCGKELTENDTWLCPSCQKKENSLPPEKRDVRCERMTIWKKVKFKSQINDEMNTLDKLIK